MPANPATQSDAVPGSGGLRLVWGLWAFALAALILPIALFFVSTRTYFDGGWRILDAAAFIGAAALVVQILLFVRSRSLKAGIGLMLGAAGVIVLYYAGWFFAAVSQSGI